MAYNKETGMYEGFIYKIWNDINDKLYIGQTKTTIKERWHGHMSSALNEKRYKSALYSAMRKYGRDKFHIEQIDKVENETYEELSSALDELEILRIQEYNSYAKDGTGYNCEYGGAGKMKRIAGKRVCKYNDDLELLEVYDSLREAARKNNVDNATIWAVCNHYYYRACGFVWAYDGDAPVKPPTREEIVDKIVKTRAINAVNNPKLPKVKRQKEYVSRALDPEVKRKRRLERLGWNGERIIQYNAFGEIINIFDDMIEAIESIPITAEELKLNLSGENLKFGSTVIRYESIPFDYFPMSPHLQPVALYDLQGKYINRFKSRKDAEDFLGVSSGEIAKVLKRGGSCKGYLVANYGDPLVRKIQRIEKTYQMIDDYGNIVKEFNSSKEISKMFGVVDCHNQIRKAILNNTKYNDYYWKYKEEFPVCKGGEDVA